MNAPERIPDLLPKALPPERLDLLQRIAALAGSLGLPLYAVGGFVRDLLLERPVLDFDLVVEAEAVKFARKLAAALGGKVTVHDAFGTAQWFPPQKSGNAQAIDLITARSERYPAPGRLPVVQPGTLADDLRRRDFSINTLALRLDGEHFGELRDDLGGVDDLRRKVVRVLHPASYRDDPTRILRAVRYEQRYGFRIAPSDLKWIRAAQGLLAELSAERVRHEFDLILEEPRAAVMLKRLAGLGVLASVHPALHWNKAVQARLESAGAGREAGWLAWLLDRSRQELEALEQRLHFEAGLRQALFAAADLFADPGALAGQKPSQCARRLEGLPLPALEAVARAWPQGEARLKLNSYITLWRQIRPHTNGDDLIRLGLKPGPAFQTILTALRDAWLDGEITSEAEEKTLLDSLR
jgi:tRNA nucleotidyltransferase (CCA-adding enzyme)